VEAGNVGTLDAVFGTLTDATRRDILWRVSKAQMSISEIAQPYRLSFAAVSKHLKVLEQAGLIIKRRVGRKHYVGLAPAAFKDAADWLNYYKRFWEANLDSLQNYMERGQ